MKTQVFEVNDFSFSYSIEGNGPTILVPGGPHHYSQTFNDSLKENFKFVFVDHRGFAKSKVEIKNLPTMDDLVKDLEAFRLYLNLEDFYILGHSGHAYLSLAYAKTYPQYLKGIILLAAGPDLSTPNREAADVYFQELADSKRKAIHEGNLQLMQQEMAARPGDEFRIFCIRSAARSSYDPMFDPTPLWQSMHLNLNVVFHMWSHLFSKEIDVEDLQKISLPVFIGMGLHDYLVPPHFTWNPYKKYIKNLTFKIFPQSGHNPQMEETETFLRELKNWIKD